MEPFNDHGRVYTEMAPLQMLAGDTSPVIRLHVTSSQSLSGASAQLILARQSDPGTQVLCVDCTQDGDGFAAVLTGEDTAVLSGMYDLHVRITLAGGTVYRRIPGTVYIRPVPQGGEEA